MGESDKEGGIAVSQNHNHNDDGEAVAGTRVVPGEWLVAHPRLKRSARSLSFFAKANMQQKKGTYSP